MPAATTDAVEALFWAIPAIRVFRGSGQHRGARRGRRAVLGAVGMSEIYQVIRCA